VIVVQHELRPQNLFSALQLHKTVPTVKYEKLIMPSVLNH